MPQIGLIFNNLSNKDYNKIITNKEQTIKEKIKEKEECDKYTLSNQEKQKILQKHQLKYNLNDLYD